MLVWWVDGGWTSSNKESIQTLKTNVTTIYKQLTFAYSFFVDHYL
jgi:hypothetical protein